MIRAGGEWLGSDRVSWHKVDGVNLIVLKRKDGWYVTSVQNNPKDAVAGPYKTSTEAKAVYELFKYDYPIE